MNYLKNQQHNRKGFTLIELLVVLVIIGFLGAYVLQNMYGAKSQGNSNNLWQQVNTIVSVMQGKYQGKGGYGTGNLNAVLINSGKAPSSLILNTTNNTITTQNGGVITITGNTTNFTVNITAQPQDICNDTLTNMPNNGFTNVIVNSTTITTFPIDPAVASTTCTGSANYSLTLTTNG